ncbi:hypothetical protein Y032_0002g499 [Ancylostoma ceylanicum]|uniref:Uncharacterized protein n=1 Tax=Ancylostoma ceylanicum TaxID=53326 RepID=A0A016W0U5_9BILA|nr:hypothetical protein Y032_0002g499 [Ancylostoma ceylanicum]
MKTFFLVAQVKVTSKGVDGIHSVEVEEHIRTPFVGGLWVRTLFLFESDSTLHSITIRVFHWHISSSCALHIRSSTARGMSKTDGRFAESSSLSP